jgi:hypothetical protein
MACAEAGPIVPKATAPIAATKARPLNRTGIAPSPVDLVLRDRNVLYDEL